MSYELLLAISFFLIILAFFIGHKSAKKNQANSQVEFLQAKANISYLNQQIMDLQNDKKALLESEQIQRIDNQDLIAQNAKLKVIVQNLEQNLNQQKIQSQDLQEKFSKEFEILANKILQDKSEHFTKVNKDNIENILTPLQEKIKNFELKVEQTHKESIDYHAALRQQIFGLQQTNTKMSQETQNLTKALKGDNKIQGNWGEMILESILEKSGLEKDREYHTQVSHTNEYGKRLQPDVIISLPANRHMVIDSKVSLLAYEQYINHSETQSQNKALQEHIVSITRHIDQLSAKRYQDIYPGSSPEFVLLFIPIETAFSVAINQDASLYNKAFEKNIVIVTPSTLLATLRTIESMWKQQKQTQNAFEIARQAGLLYDKFVGLTQDLTKIGKKLDEAKIEYDNAFNKLSQGKGNLIGSVQKLKDMGAKAKKSLDTQLTDNQELHF
ncbi:DNA recombination protein RmuC [Myroides sp. LJL119]